MCLDYELMRAIFASKTRVVSLDQIDFEGFILEDNNVLQDSVHLEDQIDKILSVHFIRFHFVQLLQVILISLQA